MALDIDDSAWVKINSAVQYYNMQPYKTPLSVEGYFQDVEASQQNFHIAMAPYGASLAFFYK